MKYTKEVLSEAVRKSKSWAEVCRILGAKPSTGMQTHITKRVKTFGIDTSHFKKCWNIGEELPVGKCNKKSIEDFLIKDSTAKSSYLRLRLVKEGIKKQECEVCGIKEWLGQAAPLELDHINSDHEDCRLENLQILCSNCHSIKTRNAYLAQRQRQMP